MVIKHDDVFLFSITLVLSVKLINVTANLKMIYNRHPNSQ